MNPVVVIPTFIYPRRHRGGADVVSTYDHSTAPNQEGEIGRCLESLAKVEGLGLVVILVSADVSLEVQAAEKVQAIANRHSDVTTLVIGAAELALIEQRMAQQNIERLSKEIGLQGYGAIRNLGLLVANVLGFDAVVFLDDDEVIDDPKFLEGHVRPREAHAPGGVPIVAKAGLFDQDSYLSKWEDKNWYRKTASGSRAARFQLEVDHQGHAGPRLSRSNHVMRRLFGYSQRKRSGASPSTRGSPVARFGLHARSAHIAASGYLVRQPVGAASPAPAHTCEARVSRQDIFRWLYEYRKLESPERSSTFNPGEAGLARALPGRPFWSQVFCAAFDSRHGCAAFGRPDKKAYRLAAKAATRRRFPPTPRPTARGASRGSVRLARGHESFGK